MDNTAHAVGQAKIAVKVKGTCSAAWSPASDLHKGSAFVIRPRKCFRRPPARSSDSPSPTSAQVGQRTCGADARTVANFQTKSTCQETGHRDARCSRTLAARCLPTMMWSRISMLMISPSCLQPTSYAVVFAAGSRVAGRMIVNQNHRSGGIPDHCTENFSRVNQTGIRCAHRNQMCIDDAVHLIQRDNVKFFLPAIDRQPEKCRQQNPLASFVDVILRDSGAADGRCKSELPATPSSSVARLRIPADTHAGARIRTIS